MEYGFSPLPEEFGIHETRSNKSAVGPDWLFDKLEAAVSALPVADLAKSVVRILFSDKNNVENDLLDLLGFECIELVSDLLQHRDDLTKDYKEDDFDQTSSCLETLAVVPKPLLPGQSVTINTTASKTATKQYRKLKQRGIIVDEPETTTFDTEAAGKDLRALLSSPSAVRLPNVFVTKKPSVSSFDGKFALPEGTIHSDFVDHEEFVIPYPKDSNQITEQISALNIGDMDRFLKKAFPGYTSLNKMQSAVFNVAHTSNENMLVCAPTGAGKTDVAMLTVLKTLRDHQFSLTPLQIAKDEFKIVYVAPMKALAAEITEKFSRRLKPFGIVVREYTGDMQLTRHEVSQTQMLVTTPEKWDVITRKSQGDVDLVQKVKLLIIDEVHLLQDDRGHVIETLVARTLRELEISQRLIRIIGLSATLPNYIDVATFLRVDPYNGLFVFGEAFRPVPLTQQFVGIKGRSVSTINENMTNVCFDKCRHFVSQGHQVMIFVHSRMETVKTAKMMLRRASEESCASIFLADPKDKSYEFAKKTMERSRNKELQALFPHGLAFHHAGMLRSDRSLVESLFSQGHIRILVCTSTLAWGVNLPAHAVIIKGTQIYDQDKGEFVQLGILDVLQIFGRAGRPQFETHGEGIILTPHEYMAKYIAAVMSQRPIESQFLAHLADNLNAETSLGTVASLDEAVSWLKYSYLYVRMRKNPTSYGITPKEIATDPDLQERLNRICKDAALQLASCGMVTFAPNDPSRTIRIRDVGRIAANFYLTRDTIETFGQTLTPSLSEEDIIAIASSAAEFNNLRVREEELRELDTLKEGAPMRLKHDVATSSGKASLLIMAYISRYQLDAFSLISDSHYIAQNGGRVLRALFEILRSQGWTAAAMRCLTMCKSFEKRVWPLQHPLSQYEKLGAEVLKTLECKGKITSIDQLRALCKREMASLVSSAKAADLVTSLLQSFPRLNIETRIAPITQNVLRVDLMITPDYDFNPQYHGKVDLWWIFAESPANDVFLHCEEFTVTRMQTHLPRSIYFFIPIASHSLPPQIYIRAVSDRWLHAETTMPISLNNLNLPKELSVQFTELEQLPLVPISALKDEKLISLYSQQFSHFNRVQTQVFDSLYFESGNVMVGAPTGSGKTIIAELAMWEAFRRVPTKKVIYIAPLKALIKERLKDWTKRLFPLGYKVVELSGDISCDAKELAMAHIVLTTPEKWDSVSRSGEGLSSSVSLMVIDEIHLLGGDRGHVLEIIVSRAKGKDIRIIGLSTALSNAADLAGWLNIRPESLFNFRPSVRPVPLEVHIDGFTARQYCPRMALMNKPAYTAILAHSPEKPVIIFVSSRRQTRLTANALVSFCANDNNPYRFVRCDEEELSWTVEQVQDPALKHSLAFGITLHHAGLSEADRQISENLFAAGKVQVMVATSTLAWGLNFPAHLVIVKGTEYFEARSHSYVDFPLTDVMQMIGRAGRPQFDTHAKAVLLVQNSKKDFYRKFLYEPFPLESCLHVYGRCADHLNAEIVNGRVKSLDDGIKFLRTTYLAIRLLRNPNYYGLEESNPTLRDEFLAKLANNSFGLLADAHCITRRLDNVESKALGMIASKFYISHRTVKLFFESMDSNESFNGLLRLLSLASEYDEFPLRHNEDVELYEYVRSPPMKKHWDTIVGQIGHDWTNPHTKVLVLLIANLANVPLPFTDFETDTRSLLDQAPRIVSSMIETALLRGHLDCSIRCIWLAQALYQSCLPTQSSLNQLPHSHLIVKDMPLPKLLHCPAVQLEAEFVKYAMTKEQIDELTQVIKIRLPNLEVKTRLKGPLCLVEIDDQRPSHDLAAYCRHDRKRHDEAWHLIIGVPGKNLVQSHRKIHRIHGRYELEFDHSKIEETKLYVISENYLALDQEITLRS